MDKLMISDLDPETAEGLRVRASRNGHSMEVEARHILTESIVAVPVEQVSLAEAIRRRFAPFGGVDDLVPHPRHYAGDPPDLKK